MSTTFAKFAGLHTTHNYVKSVPEGALATAENVVLGAQDVIEPRRGQYSLSYTAGGQVKQLWAFGSDRLVHYGTSIARDTGSAFSAYSGTFTAVDDTLCRMRGVEAAQNFYVNTATGVKVLDDASTGSFTAAGVPQCLDVYELGMTTSASGFLVPDRSVAYRATVAQKDVHGQWREGAPSQRTVVSNPASITIASGQISRAANVVTVALTFGDSGQHWKLAYGDTITLSTSEANFASGVKTITGTTINGFFYSEVGANATSTIQHTFIIPNRSVVVTVGIPSGVTSSDTVKLHRTETAPTAATDPGDEMYQVDEQNPPAAISATSGNVVVAGGSAGNIVTVTYNSHPFVLGQSVECSGQAGIPSGVNIIVRTTANTFVYLDSTATLATTSNQTLTYTPRTLVFDDNTPDTMLGDPLYTNPNTGDGLEASHYEPPMAKDMCRFGGRIWWLNTTQKHRFELQLVGVGSPDGVQNGDTITFTVSGTPYTYTAAVAGAMWPYYSDATYPGTHIDGPSARLFPPFGPSRLTTPEQIEYVAQAFVRCINQDESTVPFYAVYQSAQNDVPGKILIVEKGVGGAAITVTASRAGSWSPILPTSGTTVSSDNSADPAGVIWSDLDQPESVPLGNALRVDAKSDPIWRGIGLRESLFVFKKQGGLYTISNQAPFRVRELDPTCRLLAPDTAVTLNNQIWALTAQGVCTITEAGVDIVGWPVDYDVRALLNTAQSTITRVPFAVAYESERQLWLWLPANGSSTTATQAYVYSHVTRSFTHVTKNRTCGLVAPTTDVMWLGSGDSNTLVRERKTFDATDYADETYQTTVTGKSGLVLSLASAANVAAGDYLDNGAGGTATVQSVNGVDVTVLATTTIAFGNTVTIYKAYPVTVELVPQSLGEPGVSKTVSRVAFSFRNAQFDLGTATVWTDEDPTVAEYTLGAVNSASKPANLHAVFGTSGAFVAPGFKITQARAPWKLIAITPQMTEQSEDGR